MDMPCKHPAMYSGLFVNINELINAVGRAIINDGDRLLIDEGYEIPVSRNRKEKVKQAIGINK